MTDLMLSAIRWQIYEHMCVSVNWHKMSWNIADISKDLTC